MRARFVSKVLTCLVLSLAPVEAWSGVGLEWFLIEPSPPSADVFNTVGPMGLPGQEAGPGASVAWPATINLALLNTLPATVQVNFPDRDTVTLTQVTSERSGSALSWTGQGGDCSAMFRVAADGGFKALFHASMRRMGSIIPQTRRHCA
jgi:hypothetical protein